jgi:putative hemolysin
MVPASALFWLMLTLLCIVTEAFYTGIEMAIVSFNKVRLQYYVSKGNQRARWISWLLQHPSRLFGTTLLGTNIAMQLGSECSRHLYAALNLIPDLAAFTQIIFVLIFAELAPIFAARRYPENLSMAGSPLVYISAKCLAPVIWAISAIAKGVNRLVGGSEMKNEVFISRDELEMILETREHEAFSASDAEELNLLARNIFTLRDKKAVNAMVPLANVHGLPSNGTIGHMRQILAVTQEPFIPIFHRDPTNIVGMAYARDLLKIPDSQRVRDYARSPWFITYETGLMQILQQFRSNQQTVAVVLNDQGRAIGLLTLDDVVEEIFPQIGMPSKRQIFGTVTIDKVFPGDLTIKAFNKQFSVDFDGPQDSTFAQLLEEGLGHHPEVGESIVRGRFQLIVEESSLLEIRKVRVRTR